MTQKILELINAQVIEIKKFIEADEPWEVPMNGKLSDKEAMDEYAKFINYSNKVMDKLKSVDFLISTLTEAKMGLTPNTPASQKAIQQLNTQLELLKCLRKPLDDINTAHYPVARYFEKGGGMY